MKRFIKRTVLKIGSIVLLTTLLVSIFVAPILPSETAHAVNTNQVVQNDVIYPIEKVEESTSNTKTFDLGDRVKRIEASMGAIHYKDSSGQWQDIDINYSEADNGDYTAKFTKLPYGIRMGDDGTRRIYPDRNDLSYWIELGKPISVMGQPTKVGDTWTWNFPNAAIIVKLQNQAVKFNFILKNSNAPNTITIPFSSQGITRVGSLLYHDGQVVGELRKPTAIDAVGIERDCQVTWGGGFVTLTLDTTGMTYPIDIDPTWEVLAATDDISVYRAPAWTSDNASATDSAGDFGGFNLGVAMRFLNINIPAASVISSSSINFTANGNYAAATCNSSISGELALIPATYSDITDFMARAWTTANVSWDNIGAWTTNAEYTSADITTVIQEIVDQGGWAAGNPISIVWEDWAGSSTANAYRSAYSYDNDPTKAPRLLITFVGSLTDAYWVGGSGNINDDDNHWAPVSGGIPGDGNIPGATTNVHIDANSGASPTITVNAAFSCLDLDFTGAITPTLAGSSAMNIYGSPTYISTMTRTYTGTITYRPATARVLTSGGTTSLSDTVLNGAGTLQLADNFTLGGTADLTYTTGSFDGNGQMVELVGTAHTVSGNWTFHTLQRTGTATKTDTLTLEAGETITCTANFTAIGNSAINRVLVQSSTLGTAATINATAFTNTDAADFMDIASTNALDISGAASYTGDCGGNTNLTFTTYTTQIWDGTTGNWDNVAKWTSRVPLPQDNVTAGGAGITITVNVPRVGGNLTFTGTPIVTRDATYAAQGFQWYGSLTMVSGMTYTDIGMSERFRGRGNYTLDTAGKLLRSLVIQAPTGNLTLASDLAMVTDGTISITNGEFNTSTYDVSARKISGTGTTVRAVTLGSGTITLVSTTAESKWTFTDVTNLTFDAGTSTIVLTNSGNNNQTFDGGGLTYNNVTVGGAGVYILVVQATNTFNTFTVDRSISAKTVRFAVGSTQTMTDFVCATSGIIVATIDGVGGWNITKAGGGLVLVDYMNIINSTAAPASTWYASTHSTDGGGNAGWIFLDPPPVVVTNPVISANTTSVSFWASGNITSSWATNATIVGFEYGIVSGVYTANTTSTGSYGFGNFLETISGLTSNTTYFFRALAVAPAGAGYGAEDNVTLLAGVSNVRGVPTSSSIILTWVPAGSNTTVMYRTDTYPAIGLDGTTIYTGGGFQSTASGLMPGQVYYFSLYNGVVAVASNTTNHLVMTTLARDIPTGAVVPPSSIIPIPTLPTTIDQSASVPPGSNLEPFTSIFLFFTSGNLTPADAPTSTGGLGMPIGNVWQIIAVAGIVISGSATYIKLKNFFIAFFVVLLLTAVAVAFHLMQAWLVPVEIVIGLGVWAIDKHYQ